ncbi:hypothetical protein POX_e06306 [Penicillium oxalicum]|uniref:hypothetical protein n=1 Tax=Penicillium oxalicum TaxID=69781 RepID=UPI0020B66DFD|nr:hypothetical protein POX_e06306 [Penicillium oxalicum]KAI2788292.1 hypothetical protein POX_e06306 [Penicillium oxalicum]
MGITTSIVRFLTHTTNQSLSSKSSPVFLPPSGPFLQSTKRGVHPLIPLQSSDQG